MAMKWIWPIVGLYLLGLTFLGGILVERVRFVQRRTAILNQYDEALRQWQAYRITLEQGPRQRGSAAGGLLESGDGGDCAAATVGSHEAGPLRSGLR